MAFKGQSFFKSSDARGFLFFLLLTSIVAVLIKLSKSYSKVYKTEVVISNVPIDKTVKSITPSEIEFAAELSGFSLVLNSFRNQEVAIDFDKLDSVSTTRFTYNTDRLSLLLKDKISGGSEFSDFESDLITVDVDNLTGKKVPVISDVAINFKSGYNAINAPLIKPDSVTVVGPQNVLNKISGLRTKAQSINNISSSVTITLELDTIAVYKDLTISDRTFIFEQEVAKFTEGSFSIPVNIRGANENDIKIFPKEIRLFFVASLEEYDSILPSDFEVVADFSETNGDEYIALTVFRKPDNVRNVRLENKQIKYIVVN